MNKEKSLTLLGLSKEIKFFNSHVGIIPKRYQNYSFDNYKIIDKNKIQIETAINLSIEQSCLIIGKTGTGKTHLAISLMKDFGMMLLESEEDIRNNKEFFENLELSKNKLYSDKAKIILENNLYEYRPANCLFISAIKFFMELSEIAIRGESKIDKLKNYCNPVIYNISRFTQPKLTNYDLIILDDVGAEKINDVSRQNLYYLIDERYRNCLPIYITSNFTIDELNALEPRLVSRMSEMGKIIQFNHEDFRLNKG